VTITKVTVGDQEIQPGLSTGPREDNPGTPFQADEGWMKNMSIVLMNRTDKVIVRAELELYFRDTGDGSPFRPVTEHIMTIGRRPDAGSFTSHGQKRPPEPDKQPLCGCLGRRRSFESETTSMRYSLLLNKSYCSRRSRGLRFVDFSSTSWMECAGMIWLV
jgi:hypothetical protein